MFIIFFSLFTFLCTVFEDRKIVVLFAIISIAIVCIWFFIIPFHKRQLIKLVGSITISFILVLLSRTLYNHYVPKTPQSSIFIDNGQIVDVLGQGKYIYFSNDENYLLYAKKDHILGENLWLVWKMPIVAKNTVELSPSTFFSFFQYSGFNQAKRFKMKGYAGSIYEDNSIVLTGISSNNWRLENVIIQTRVYLREKVIQTYKDTTWQNKNQTAALILGMLIGDKSLFSKDDYQSFVDSWLVHLVAVSGGNIVMLVVFLMAILFFIPFYPRLFIILLFVVGYGMICGMDSSVVRAVIMWGMSLIALFWWRKPSTWRLLGTAYVIMLLYNPYFLVYDVGFLLSFAAVIGILICNTKITHQEDINKPITKKSNSRIDKIKNRIRKENLQPSLGATLWIFPIIIFFMGKINLVSILGNLIVLPIVALIMIGWFIGIWLPWWLKILIFWWEKIFVTWIFVVSQKVGEYGVYILVEDLRIKYCLLWISILVIFSRQGPLMRYCKISRKKMWI